MDEDKKKNLQVRVLKSTALKSLGELQWREEEERELARRILGLREDQIAALVNLAGLNFALSDIEDVVQDIVRNKAHSGHLPILIYEAGSKKLLLWWIGYFEKHNKSQKRKQRVQKAAETMAAKVKSQWPDKKEWFAMYDKLMMLSLEELRDLTTKLGIIFTGGNDQIKNKRDFVLVLDEADKNELLKEYKNISRVKRS